MAGKPVQLHILSPLNLRSNSFSLFRKEGKGQQKRMKKKRIEKGRLKTKNWGGKVNVYMTDCSICVWFRLCLNVCIDGDDLIEGWVSTGVLLIDNGAANL